MQCSACGTQLPRGANACPNCGALSPAYHLYSGSNPDDNTQLSPNRQSSTVASKQQPAQDITQNQYGTPNYIQQTPQNGSGIASSAPNRQTESILQSGQNVANSDPNYTGVMGGTDQNRNTQRTTNPYGDSYGSSLYHTDPPPPPPFDTNITMPKEGRKKRGLPILLGILIILLLIGLSAWLFPTILHPAKTGPQTTATLTANNAQTLYKQTTSTKPTLSDALSGPDNLGLDNYAGPGNSTRCFFSGDMYHSTATPGYFSPCYAKTTNYQNFVAEITMKMVSGHSGGLVFRANSTNDQGYQFRISTDGTYILNRIILDKQGNPISNNETITSGSSTFVHKGTGKSNQIAVLVQGNTIALFINDKYVAITTDPTYGSGQLGIYVDSDADSVEGAFSNLKIWQLA